jgi:4-amino-4-deoxy-L-arabinose transferase-like glycosyltransferase
MVAITGILLLAALLRLWALGEVPPGLAHDEVANWLIARDVLAGGHAIYFTAAYGHEPLYQYVQAATVALFGNNWLGLRFPSVAFGLLGVAATYVLLRYLFDSLVALLTAGWLAVSFWPLFYARVALRAITLPFTGALCFYLLARAAGLRPSVRRGRHGLVCAALAGLALGVSLYTYMAARVLPLILLVLLLYLSIVRRSMPLPWYHLVVFFLVAVLVSAPLVAWLVKHPGVEYRVAEVGEPLERLLAGDPSLVWRNLVANLGFFTVAGDPWPRQNVPGRPVFADLISAVLFYAGLLIALWRWRGPRYGFLLVWLAGALVPSVVTLVAPSSIRNVLGLVVVFAFPSLAMAEAWRWLRSRNSAVAVGTVLAIVPIAVAGLFTVRDYFGRWPQDEVVRFDYQSDLTATARRLDELAPETPIAVAGLSVHTMDGPSLDLATRRDAGRIRLCDTRETLVVPGMGVSWLFVPAVVPLEADLADRLLGWGAELESDRQGAFVGYHLVQEAGLREDLEHLETGAALPDGTLVTLPTSFGRFSLLGYERLGESLVPGGSITLLTYWRVVEPSSTQLKIFVHLLGRSGILVTQHDGLGSPPRGWAPGDLIVQRHVLSLPVDLAAGQYHLSVGAYDPVTGARLPVQATDRLLLCRLEVAE